MIFSVLLALLELLPIRSWLLKDAQAITGTKYDINNLADVYTAIGVIQDKLNITGTTAREGSNNLIIAYITSQLKRLELPTHVVLQWYGGLKKVSVVQTEQLATIDKGDVISVIDHLTDADMARVDQALLASLGLEVSA